ncbi:MAG TPA: S41 family peptidase [Gammaproteobacteria bacterium]|nr:S41 family peptidase [Gammaproteobacteria bacterium]
MRPILPLLAMLVATAAAPASAVIINPSDEALAYLDQAIRVLETRFREDRSIDWVRLRTNALLAAPQAVTPADTYPAIREVVAALDSGRVVFQTPEDMAAVASGDDQQEDFGIRAEKLAPNAGYLGIPVYTGPSRGRGQRFAETLQKQLAELDGQGVCGWIIDLRNTRGGNLFPALAGIGPLLGSGVAGYFVNPDGRAEAWGYWRGSGRAERAPETQVDIPYRLKRAKPPIAVLIGPQTAGGGEGLAVSFQGRSNVRLFGARTAAQTNLTDRLALADGAEFIFTVPTTLLDRLNRPYPQGVPPDETVGGGGTNGDHNDAALAAAREWLASQPGCE